MPTRRKIAHEYLNGSPLLRDALGMPEDAAIEPIPIGKGEHNDNYRFDHPLTGQKLVLRISYSSQMGLHDQVGYEFGALQELSGCPRTPAGLFVDNSRSTIPYGTLVEEFLEGECADYHDEAELRACTVVLADVHSVLPSPHSSILKPSNPLETQLATCERFCKTYCSSPFATGSVVEYLDFFLEKARLAAKTPFDERFSRHIQNTEAVPSHFLLVHDEQGKLAGPSYMVDWEKPVIGEVSQDLAYFLSPTTTIWDTDVIFSSEQRETLVEAYWEAVDGRFERGNFEERFDAYVKMNCLLGISWSCNAFVEYHDPNRPLKNPATFELLKTYLSQDFLERCRLICFDR